MILSCSRCGTYYKRENGCPHCPKQKFGEIALGLKYITPEQIDSILEQQKQDKLPMGELLIKSGLIDYEKVGNIIKKQGMTVFFCQQCKHIYNCHNFPANQSTANYPCSNCGEMIGIAADISSLKDYKFGGALVNFYSTKSEPTLSESVA